MKRRPPKGGLRFLVIKDAFLQKMKVIERIDYQNYLWDKFFPHLAVKEAVDADLASVCVEVYSNIHFQAGITSIF